MLRAFETNFTVFPHDCNFNEPPSIFGGKMMAEMDICAAMTCRRALYDTHCTDAITVGVTDVNFTRPAYIGEIVHVKGLLMSVGEKSMTVHVVCYRENRKGHTELMATGKFTFVSRKNGIPTPHQLTLEPGTCKE